MGRRDQSAQELVNSESSSGRARCVTRKLWTRSRSQDAAAKYRLHYAPHYPRLHSAFREAPACGGEGARRGGSKIQEIPSRKSLSAPSSPAHRNGHESGADRYDSWHSGDYLYAICRSCRRDEQAKERIGTIS